MADLFEQYFRQADRDGDGRISGQEAVSFFQATGLPQVTLAKIWQFSDQRNAGFLSRPEFFNALKLVTVAQSNREISADLVRLALTEPAASQIPPPRISPPPTGPGSQAPPQQNMPQQQQPGTFAPQYNPLPQGYAPQQFPPNQGQMSYPRPGAPPQGPGQFPGGFPGQRPPQGFVPAPGQGPGPQYSAQLQSQFQPRPQYQPQPFSQPALQPQSQPGSQVQQPQRSGPPSAPQQRPTPALPQPQQQAPTTAPPVPGQQPPVRPAAAGAFADFSSLSTPAPAVRSKSQQTAEPAAKPASPPLPDLLGGADDGGFAAFSPTPNAALPAGQPTPVDQSAAPAPAPSPPPPVTQPPPPAPVSASVPPPPAIPPSGPKTFTDGAFSGSGFRPDTRALAPPPPAATAPGMPWPKMSVEDAQRYTRVFAGVDTDRDGKVTGAEARKLLSGVGLPREVLRALWDLSDMDKDGMLSLREFCTTLYFIDRIREGRDLPPHLPPGIHFDDPQGPLSPEEQRAQFAATRLAEAQAAVAQNSQSAPWRLDPSMLSSAAPPSVPRAPTPLQTAVGQMPVSAQDASAATTGPTEYRSKAPPLEAHKTNQLEKEEQSGLRERHKAAEEADRRVWSTDAQLLDSKQKTDFYRTKMQEIVLFKTKCDNRLNEISERADAEQREVGELAKRYDEKYKATEGAASRLAVEENNLREMQEKKSELYRAVVRLEQGGPPNAFLQEKTDRLAAELEDLRKVVNRRAKQLGLVVRPMAGSEEVPFGWQGGLQENAVEWDDEWDEFIDQGFDLANDVGDGLGPLPVFHGGAEAESKGAQVELVENGLEGGGGEEGVGGGGGEEYVENEGEEGEGGYEKTPTKVKDRYEGLADPDPAYSSHSPSLDMPAESSAADTYEEGGGWSAFGARNGDDEAESGVRTSWQSAAESTEVSTDFGGGRPAFGTFADFDQLGFDSADKDNDGDRDIEPAVDNGKHKNVEEEEEEGEEEEEEEEQEEQEEQEEEGLKDPFAAFNMFGKSGKPSAESPGFRDWGSKPTTSSNIGSAEKSGFGAFETGEEADSKPAFNASDSWSKF